MDSPEVKSRGLQRDGSSRRLSSYPRLAIVFKLSLVEDVQDVQEKQKKTEQVLHRHHWLPSQSSYSCSSRLLVCLRSSVHLAIPKSHASHIHYKYKISGSPGCVTELQTHVPCRNGLNQAETRDQEEKKSSSSKTPLPFPRLNCPPLTNNLSSMAVS